MRYKIYQQVCATFIDEQVALQAWDFCGGLGMANAWVVTLDAAVDDSTLGKAVREGLSHARRDPPEDEPGPAWGLVSKALGFRSEGALTRAGSLIVDVSRLDDVIKVLALTTEWGGSGATTQNWRVTIDESSDDATLGRAVRQAREHCIPWRPRKRKVRGRAR